LRFPLFLFTAATVALSIMATLLPAPPPARAAGTCAVANATMDADATAFLQIINSYRAQNGLSTLTVSPALTRDATWMATDLATKNYFSHTDSLGRDPWTRAADCGYSSAGGENLAAGTDRSTAASAFALFRNSPEHNGVMLTAEFREIGIARVYAAGSTYHWYWATEFGRGSPPAPAAATPVLTATPPPPPPTARAATPQQPASPAAAAAQVQAQVVVEGATTVLTPAARMTLMHLTWGAATASPAEVVHSAAGPVLALYEFDPATGQWLHYAAGVPGFPNNLAALNPGHTYWGIFAPSP